MSTVCSARGTVEIGFIAARTRSTSPVRHAAFGAARAPGDPADGPVGVAHDLVVGLRTRGVAASSNPSPTSTPLIAWMPISAAGQPGVEAAVPVHVAAQARRQAVAEHLDHPAQGVAVLAGRVDLGDHRRARRRVEAAHRVGIDRPPGRPGPGTTPAGRRDRADARRHG